MLDTRFPLGFARDLSTPYPRRHATGPPALAPSSHRALVPSY